VLPCSTFSEQQSCHQMTAAAGIHLSPCTAYASRPTSDRLFRWDPSLNIIVEAGGSGVESSSCRGQPFHAHFPLRQAFNSGICQASCNQISSPRAQSRKHSLCQSEGVPSSRDLSTTCTKSQELRAHLAVSGWTVVVNLTTHDTTTGSEALWLSMG